VSIIYIFYGLYLIKQESTGYQFKMLLKNRELHKKNVEIEEQKKEIVHKAQLLEEQAAALDEHNKVKDKLFSIISHDLKSPMYALQNVFSNAQKFDLPGEEIKSMLPDVVNDLIIRQHSWKICCIGQNGKCSQIPFIRKRSM